MAPFVTCQIFGQLGNQLYQVATTLAYALDTGCESFFPALHQTQDRISYNRDRLFFRLNTSALPRNIKYLFQEKTYYSIDKPPVCEDLLLSGYFQSWRHFDHRKEQICSLLAPSADVLGKLQTKYRDLLSHPCTVAVHVRTQCLSGHISKLHPFIGFDYYRDAMTHFPKNALFVVFSDRINWCKYHFPKQCDRQMVFIEDNDGVEDLFLMSMMKHVILCNSTFSWWGAYLNRQPERIAISPQYWCDPAFQPDFPTWDYFPPDWRLLPTRFDISFPEDMEKHGDIFQSVNG